MNAPRAQQLGFGLASSLLILSATPLIGACGDQLRDHAEGSGSDPMAEPLAGRDDRAIAEHYWQVVLSNYAQQTDFRVFKNPGAVALNWSLDGLPRQGRTASTPWSQSYWSFASGGVVRRLSTGQGRYPVLTKAEVLAMDTASLSKLSPTEKYDIMQNLLRDDPEDPQHFMTTKRMRDYTATENAKGFELGGFCHGSAVLAATVREPKGVLLNHVPHIPKANLRLSSADIAALMSLNQHLTQGWAIANSRYAEVGQSCPAQPTGNQATPLKSGDGCRAINAGVFHVLVTNQLGRFGLPVLVDTRPDYVVLNEPLYAFELDIMPVLAPHGSLAFDEPVAAGAASVRYITMKATFARSPSDAQIEGGARLSTVRSYKYRLELNSEGEIVGGSWARPHGKDSKPDFIWTLGITPADSSLPGIYELYRRSLAGP